MADIQQAAKWMTEGKRVRRANWSPQYFIGETPHGFLLDDRKENPSWLMIEDLLADDWQEFVWIN
jgi:hypothetical protein